MQSRLQISVKEARYLALHSQFLLDNIRLEGKKGLLKIINQIGYIQIDTISVVERSHRHILWTRLPQYSEDMLSGLIDNDKKVFEYWSHAAAFLPMRDYRFSLYRKKKFESYNKIWGKWAQKNRKIIKYVYDRIKAEGALQSNDFEHAKKRGGWWDWKPSKTALEYLFHKGILMLKARKNFQKIYDLPERILPDKIVTAEPTDNEYAEHLIMNAINSNGIAAKNEIVYQKFYLKEPFERTLDYLKKKKKNLTVKIDNLKQEYYTTERVLKILNGENTHSPRIHILSPFDNLVIQRKRLNDLFNFNYTLECYVPADKRKFGYFCLPVLYGDKFIGRIDAKAGRKERIFYINKIFYETNSKWSKKTAEDINNKIEELAIFAGCKKVVN